MPLFSVEAIDIEGNKIRRLFEVDSENRLLNILEASGLTPIKIHKLPGFFKYLNISKFFQKIKKAELIEVLDNLHLIVQSGLPLNTGIMDLAKDAENTAIKDMLLDISFQIQGGMPLSQAVERYKNIFGDVVISLFKIGEETGTLDQTLKDAAEHLRKIEDIKSKAKQALIYPAFAFFSTLSAMIFWLVYVLPKIIEAFKTMNIELPWTTRMVMAISEFTQNYFFQMLGFLVLAIIIILFLRRKFFKFKYQSDKVLLKLPIIGIILKNFNYAFFAEYMRLMISAGLPLYQALNIMEKAMNNSLFKVAIRNVREEIEMGESLSKALKKQNLFSSLIIRMISVGEQTGGLDTQLSYIADYYYKKVDYITQNIAKMIEPIVIGIVGGFMALIMISLMGPIYTLISQIGKM
ncbi:type II secretion system F family protein [Hydrogenothermus marinus]|uniref:Type IV pilus assembly protein PilC n=1 Tax=Hydrogenothermus marinus TaxID=133270 RepID=A0A3M0BJN3_9AQUI|nr:type II secretion system F family protein [Hydrogenothermus marinus]RMA97540.1 type IV pilus assembly protein PilC [Hydrogenothermus marinus]